MKAFDLQVTGSLIVTGSIRTTDGTFILSGSDSNASASFSTRVTSNESNMTLATASIAALTASISRLNTEISTDDTDMTLATASIALNESNMTLATASIALNESNMTLATASIAAITASIADNLDQAVKQASAVTFATVDTGQGANELYDMNQNVKTDSNVTFGVITSGDINSSGTITATEIHTTFVSSSITVASGSNTFGDDTSDSHQFTGSVDVSGSFTLRDGDMTVSDTLTATNIGAFTAGGAIDFNDQNMTNVDIDSGDITGVTFGTATSTIISGSTTAVSSSIATRFDSREVDMTLATASIAAITSSIGGIVGGEALLISGSVASTGSFGSIAIGGTGVNSFTGNVGIGTTSPEENLHVSGAGIVEIKVQSTDDDARFHAHAVDAQPALLTLTSGTDNSTDSFTIATHQTAKDLRFIPSQDPGDDPVVTILQDGKVGIGISTSITDPLHVKTTAAETRISLESSTGKWAIGAEDGDKFGILNYGTSTPFIIDSSGKVGIGTASPSQVLTIKHSEPSILFIHDSTELGFIGDCANFLTGNSPSASSFGVRSDGDFRIGTGGNNLRMTIASDGNVGIGTASPDRALTVAKTSDNSGNGTGGALKVCLGDDLTKTVNIGFDSSDYGFIEAVDEGVAFKNLALCPTAGNVGISEASPDAKLHVTGQNSYTTANIGEVSGLGFVRFQPNGNNEDSLWIHNGGNVLGLQASTNANSSTAENITLNAYGGNVGIGTATPTAANLQVVGTSGATACMVINAESHLTTNDKIFYANFNNNSGNPDDDGHFFYGQDNHEHKVSIYSDGDVFTKSGDDIAALSDERLKTNISDYSDGLTLINSLKPRKFNWKEGINRPTDTQYGFIAQELEEVTDKSMRLYKKRTLGEDASEHKYIDDGVLYTSQLKGKDAQYVSAIQELHTIIQKLSAKVEALENA